LTPPVRITNGACGTAASDGNDDAAPASPADGNINAGERPRFLTAAIDGERDRFALLSLADDVTSSTASENGDLASNTSSDDGAACNRTE
jgi:hypothetical protein